MEDNYDQVLIYKNESNLYECFYRSNNPYKFEELFKTNKIFFDFKRERSEKVEKAIELYLWTLNFNGDMIRALENLENTLG